MILGWSLWVCGIWVALMFLEVALKFNVTETQYKGYAIVMLSAIVIDYMTKVGL